MQYNLIVAFDNNLGIGFENKLPWNIREDMCHFKKLTENGIVVMGRNTYLSIPEKNRPLKNRINIVITNGLSLDCPISELSKNVGNETDTWFVNMCNLNTVLDKYKNHKFCWIIGGELIYKHFIKKCSKIYVTLVEGSYKCDKYFPLTSSFVLHKYSESLYSDTEKCKYRFLEFNYSCKSHEEYSYLTLLNNIFLNGDKRNDRTGTGTLGIFGSQLRFNLMRNNTSVMLPLLTTKFVPYKMILKELLWFVRGQTDNKILQDQGVHIWDGNSTKNFIETRNLPYREGDIGAMYGWQLRHFGAVYEGCDKDYTGCGIDQLKNVIDLIKNDPCSRRIMMTTYNVSDLEKGVLHPCHGIVIQFYVESEKYLNCHMYQRSVDCGCGLPFNIASYAFLTFMLSLVCNLTAKELIISTGDTHIYNNHIDKLIQQTTIEPYPFPVCNFIGKEHPSIDDFKVEDFELVGYIHHAPIKLEMSV